MLPRISIDYIRSVFVENGYKLLSDEYRNSRTKLKYECPNGHVGYMKWDHFRDGHRCGACSGNKKLSIDVVRKDFESNGYVLLSTEYINSNYKLVYICPKGHENSMSWNNWRTGHRCPDCANNKKYSRDFVSSNFKQFGYELLTDVYSSGKQELQTICPNGHEYIVTWDNWNSKGSRCPKCNCVGISKQEQELINHILLEGCDIITNDVNIISPYELDIVIPDKKLAIEYCGLYWHSELAGKDRKYHVNKLKLCESAGYKLVTVFEDEWLYKKEIVLSRLRNIINSNSLKKIYARDCEIKYISTREAREFCIENHLQGYAGSAVKLGAYYNDKLVSVMTFSKPSISKGRACGYDKNVWELNRFCSKIGCRVVGIASKFIARFDIDYNYPEIMSYADLRWSVGNLYKSIGFIEVKTTQPNYWYITKDRKRVHRFSLRKTKKDPTNLTEWQIRRHQGCNRIWDCGNLKYIRKSININASYPSLAWRKGKGDLGNRPASICGLNQ